MRVIVFIVAAVVGSALYGLLLGTGLFAIYLLRGAPGSTGMEIVMLPMLTTVSTIAGTSAAVVALALPRTRLA